MSISVDISCTSIFVLYFKNVLNYKTIIRIIRKLNICIRLLLLRSFSLSLKSKSILCTFLLEIYVSPITLFYLKISNNTLNLGTETVCKQVRIKLNPQLKLPDVDLFFLSGSSAYFQLLIASY